MLVVDIVDLHNECFKILDKHMKMHLHDIVKAMHSKQLDHQAPCSLFFHMIGSSL